MLRRLRRRYLADRRGHLAEALANAPALHEGATPQGAEFLVIAGEADRRVENGSVWGLEGDLQALGVSVDDDVKGLLTRVVARGISTPSQDCRARRYGRKFVE